MPPEPNYRAIFDASANSILIMDWDSGRVLEVTGIPRQVDHEDVRQLPPEGV